MGRKADRPTAEVDLSFDPEGLYALLYPRRDGNAINLRISRAAGYDTIHYELAYQSTNEFGEQMDRGVTGDIDTKNKHSDYDEEILFGTCSRGNTWDPLHCVFDRNVENGTLTLMIQRGSTLYKMITAWHMQRPDIALGRISSADNHFTYQVKATTASEDEMRQRLALTGFVMVNDLSGVPKLPSGKRVLGKVYALNAPLGKDFLPGTVSLELAENPPPDASLGYFKVDGDAWQLLDSKISGSTVTAEASSSGIFAVLINSTDSSR